jgi:O-antigen ligase
MLERAIALILLLAILWSVFWFGGVRNGEFWIASAAVGISLALWAVRLWAGPGNRFLLPPVTWTVALFIAYAVWRHSVADVPYVSRMELFLLITCAAAFFAALHNLHRQEIAGWFVHGLVLVGMLVSAYALIQCLQESNRVLWAERPASYLKRYGGTFVNPNHLAGFLLLVMPLALANAFLSRGSAIVKVLHGYAALVMMAGIAVTMSRGGWIGTLVALVVFSSWLWRRPQFRIPLAAFGVLLAVGVILFVSNSDKARARIEAVNVAGRADSGLSRRWIWEPAWKMGADHRMYGVGPAHFDVRFPAYRTVPNQIDPQHVHNEYLELLVDYGVVGVSIVGTGILLFLYGLWRTSKHVERGASDLGVKSSNRTAFFAGSVTGLAGFGCHCLFEFNLHVPAIALVASVLMGMVISNTRFATERFWFTPNLLSRISATALVAGSLVWLFPVAFAAGMEGRRLERALEIPTLGDAFFAELRAAEEYAPDNPVTASWYGEEMRRMSWQGLEGWESQAREAVDWLEKSARLNPFNARTHMTLALCHQWLGDMGLAATEIERAAVMGPNDVQIANALAWNRLSRGDYDKAREAVRLALQLNPWDNWEARSYEARLRALPGAR